MLPDERLALTILTTVEDTLQITRSPSNDYILTDKFMTYEIIAAIRR